MTEWLCSRDPLHPFPLPTEGITIMLVFTREIYGHGSIEKRVDEEDEVKGKRRKVISKQSFSLFLLFTLFSFSLRPLNL